MDILYAGKNAIGYLISKIKETVDVATVDELKEYLGVATESDGG